MKKDKESKEKNKDKKEDKQDKNKDHKTKKILFILKKRNFSYGPSFGLLNSCRMIGDVLREKHGITSEIKEVIDGNGIDKEVHNEKPTHVFLEAIWCPPYKVDELVKKYKKINWFIRLHSDSPFLQREGIAIEWLKEYGKLSKKHNNFTISCNSQRIKEELELALNIKSIYAPNVYWPESYPEFFKKKNDDYLDIGCFGAIRELKAILPQALAAVIYGNLNNIKIKFHINGNRLEGDRTESILKNLTNLFKDTKHKLIIHDWLLHSDLIKLIQKEIDIGMAVSFSETFCITAYDFVTNKVPVVGSNEIKYILKIFKADPTSYKSMVSALNLASNSRINKLHYLNNLLLHFGNSRAIKEWLEILK